LPPEPAVSPTVLPAVTYASPPLPRWNVELPAERVAEAPEAPPLTPAAKDTEPAGPTDEGPDAIATPPERFDAAPEKIETVPEVDPLPEERLAWPLAPDRLVPDTKDMMPPAPEADDPAETATSPPW
jgi:hypothetical protein